MHGVSQAYYMSDVSNLFIALNVQLAQVRHWKITNNMTILSVTRDPHEAGDPLT